LQITAQDYLEALPYLTPEERAEIDVLLASSPPDPAYWESEKAKCAASEAYFVSTYVWIYDNESAAWIRFGLWREQRDALELMGSAQQTVFLKARQLGLSWLSLSKILHECQFRPISSANIFSLRENEAAYLLGRERFRGMWERLPIPLRSPITSDNVTHLGFANGSHVRAFPTTAGDSYAATLALVDEADLVPDLNRLLRRVKPSIDAGGRIMLVSRSDKANPESEFKRIYRAAKAGKTDWKAMFLPWHVRPGRTPEWYAAQCRDALANTGSLDDVHEQYPATDAEALAPRSLDKRLPSSWLQSCYHESLPIPLESLPDAPAIAELVVYEPPQAGRAYVLGCDPAEGLPGGDDTAIVVLAKDTGEQVAECVGKLEPKRVTPDAVSKIAAYYNGAECMVERNNHGHAVIAGCEDATFVMSGRDGKRGWVESTLGKTILYDTAADAIKNRETTIRSFTSFTQLASIDRVTLSAPKGQHDDYAVAYALALLARVEQRAAAFEWS
jgi:hypothetical protein